jgi:dienelactone hydrolase
MNCLVKALMVVAGVFVLAASPAGAAPTITVSEPLPASLWVPGAAAAHRVTYSTQGASGAAALSTGTVQLPAGTPPPGGWPVVAWAHGTSGIADACAPSVVGPLEPERDRAYLSRWLAEGYAIVASDYAGLGTPGVHAYLNGPVAARNVVDMVRAAADYSGWGLSRRWVVVGQSQGGAVAVVTARYATQLGEGALDYRGGVATGVPAYTEHLIGLLGPGIPPFPLSPSMTLFTLYILAGLRESFPQDDLGRLLTPLGRRWLERAEQTCPLELREQLRGVVVGTLLRRPLAQWPGGFARLKRYLGVPERGFDRPLFVGQGTRDTVIPAPLTYLWAERVRQARQPVIFRSYPGATHDSTLDRSLPESLPFVRGLFDGAAG